MAQKRGFTLIELLVVIAIIAILAAILFPVFLTGRKKAQQTSCMANIKQWGMAALRYTDDYNGRMVLDYHENDGQICFWRLQPYIKNWKLAVCPGLKKQLRVFGKGYDGTGYGINLHVSGDYWSGFKDGFRGGPLGRIPLLSEIPDTKGTMIFADAPMQGWDVLLPDWVDQAKQLYISNGTGHLGQINIVWVDSHVGAIQVDALKPGMFTLQRND